mgnify:CR=1 FL=1
MNNVAANILKRSMENIKTEDVDIIPCNRNILVEFYPENPYRTIETTDTGLILGVESTKKYKSNETGEMEDSQEYIDIAKVIAVGPNCTNCVPGEDVCLIRHIAVPVPFRKKNWYMIDEANVLCRFVKK